MKVRCSGGDVCTRCLQDNVEDCVYGDRRRERSKKGLKLEERVNELEEENEELLAALRQVSLSTDLPPDEIVYLHHLVEKVSSPYHSSEIYHNPIADSIGGVLRTAVAFP